MKPFYRFGISIFFIGLGLAVLAIIAAKCETLDYEAFIVVVCGTISIAIGTIIFLTKE